MKTYNIQRKISLIDLSFSLPEYHTSASIKQGKTYELRENDETTKRFYVPTTIPPSTRSTSPVIKLASSEAKKR